MPESKDWYTQAKVYKELSDSLWPLKYSVKDAEVCLKLMKLLKDEPNEHSEIPENPVADGWW